MELAHLDPILWEGVEQATHSVNDDSSDGVAHTRYRLHGFHVVCHGLVLDEGHVEGMACGIVQGKQHAPVATPVGHVEVDEPACPLKTGLLPSDVDSTKPALDGRRAFPCNGGYLADRLLVGLVERPKLLVSHRVTRAELVSAGHTLVKLFPVPGAVALGYPRAARRAFFLFIRPFFEVFKSLQR